MWYYIDEIYSFFYYGISRMDMREWGLFVLVIVAVGIYCMRGYGSRKNY